MKNNAKHRFKIRGLIFMSIFGISNHAVADSSLDSDIVYYSNEVKSVDISSTQQMILIFPDSPFGVSCQSQDKSAKNKDKLLDLKPAEDNSSALSLDPSGINSVGSSTNNLYNGMPNKLAENQKTLAKELLSKRLILTPLKSGVAVCSFELANKDNFTIEFHLNKSVVKPTVEFKNLYQNVRNASKISQSLGGLGIFKVLISGDKISFFSDVTPASYEIDSSWRSENADYTVNYVGTDKYNFKAWNITAKPNKQISNFVLKPKNLGDLYYSTYVNIDALKQSESYEKNDLVKIYILSRADLTNYELEAMLP